MHLFSTREQVIQSLVEKCFGAARAGTKQKATDIVLLYAEIDQPDGVIVSFFTKYVFLATYSLLNRNISYQEPQ